ncbi:MAG TPA: nitrous oxide-stimulated promoter family protein [Thermodesulfobacteriota bacterium]|nr:nitrous oxide-stimulated promoter family protein [Thermodesulfobacteriota bacterium]
MKESGIRFKKEELPKTEKDDIRTLMKFVGIYCRENHDADKSPFSFKLFDIKDIEGKEILLCPDCTRLLTYGLTMRLKCPHDPKPMCKKCETQCYHGEYKSKIREVMKFSGMYLVKHGRIDLLYHYFR